MSPPAPLHNTTTKLTSLFLDAEPDSLAKSTAPPSCVNDLATGSSVAVSRVSLTPIAAVILNISVPITVGAWHPISSVQSIITKAIKPKTQQLFRGTVAVKRQPTIALAIKPLDTLGYLKSVGYITSEQSSALTAEYEHLRQIGTAITYAKLAYSHGYIDEDLYVRLLSEQLMIPLATWSELANAEVILRDTPLENCKNLGFFRSRGDEGEFFYVSIERKEVSAMLALEFNAPTIRWTLPEFISRRLASC